MSIDSKIPGIVNSIHKLNENQQHDTEYTNNSTVKNQLRFNNVKVLDNSIQSNQNSAKINSINISVSNCVTNLNLTKMHIDSLKIKTSIKVTKDNINLNVKHNDAKSHYGTVEKNASENGGFIEPLISQIDIYQIELIKQLYSNIENNYSEYSEYVILVLYQLIKNTQLINKQLITAIPIVKGIPERSVTEITTISDSGKLFKHKKTICLHKGRIRYTNDWITIENVERINIDNTLFKFSANYNDLTLHGLALNKACENSLKLSSCTLYISDFSKVWN